MSRPDLDPRTRKLADDAERLQRDTRLDGWRTPARRRALVLATLAVLALVAALAWFDRSVALLVAIAVAAGLYVLLRRVVRGMADLPDAFVDERVRAMRNDRYRTAYQVLSAVVMLLLLAGYMATDASRLSWKPEAHHLHAAFWTVLGLSLALPSMLVAWSEREL
jgi:uncharacterized membrane protein